MVCPFAACSLGAWYFAHHQPSLLTKKKFIPGDHSRPLDAFLLSISPRSSYSLSFVVVQELPLHRGEL
jgi:hypothetical protein